MNMQTLEFRNHRVVLHTALLLTMFIMVLGCAPDIRAAASVVAWGDNAVGQTNVPPGLTNVVLLTAGMGHSLALHRAGTVTAWGDNSFGPTNVPPDLSNTVARFYCARRIQ